ncbi:hypothetical protein BCR35DRAFT_308979 [Leucosporidium creatinivorum]|uniref:THIF-type NAD/FAD binding fold domain-containing protein n=1 Tax=Leucosporidium creatinivorum TaxID=106004 RepID=A0A1Y2DU89_9BASI|nr:hypothetical protein BCR35DRAFT_308979 [Leucosporidium creatinivorum]
MSSTSSSSSLLPFSLSLTPTQTKLLLTATTTAALTTISILTTQHFNRRHKRNNLRDDVEGRLKRAGAGAAGQQDEGEDEEEEMIDFTRPLHSHASTARSHAAASSAPTTSSSRPKKPTSPVIIRESLARNYVFFGEQGMSKIRQAFVVIIGLGGVGSAAATMLVRSGVKKVRLVDFDQVSLSSLNRHSTATLSQVGTPKVHSCADYFASVAPWVEVDARVELFSKEDAERLLEGKPDFVVDAIDNIDSKVDLLLYCHRNNIPVFSSLGAAAKSDPSRIQVSDISTTFEDPLARSVRRRLKLEGVLSGIPVVYSTEKPRADIGLLPLPEDEFLKGQVDELSAIANFRVRILPVLGPLPAMFGNAAATYVLQQLAGFPMEPLPVKNRHKMAASLHRQLSVLEFKLTGSNKLPLTEEDVLYLFEEIHRARSVAPPLAVPSRPCLVRWRKEEGVRWDNLVVMEREEGARHEQLVLLGTSDPEEVWGPEVTALVRKRTEEERRVRAYRI